MCRQVWCAVSWQWNSSMAFCKYIAIPKTGLGLVFWALVMIQPSKWVKIMMKWGFWGHWGRWGCWDCRGHCNCRDSKASKITTGDFRVIQVLEFSFILMFWKNIFLEYNHEISSLILAPFLSEAVEASQCYFFEKWLWYPKIPYLSIPESSLNQI